MQKLYVGNLPSSATEIELLALFEPHGSVLSVKLISDRETGRPRGFGFIEMESECANAARSALDGSEFCGRLLRVDDAEEHESRRTRKSW